jgi:RNA polymerase sigma-70 factor (ECF subfamily)
MTAGLFIHEVPAIHDVTLARHVAGAALPVTAFSLPPKRVDGLAPGGTAAEGRDPREAPLEGEADNRLLIDTLVAAAVGGDNRARDELLALIHPLVLKYCRARLGRQESLMGSADDVAQDVCMAVVGALPNYQLKGLSFRAFVYGIAAHKVTDAFRAIGRNRAEPVADLPDGPVTADGPEHRLLAAEMSARLGALLKHLTARQREVLVLRLAVGLSAEETAQAVRSTPGAVRVTQHRALGRLRRILLGESVARVLADPTTDDPTADELRATDAVPDTAADDTALDAVAVMLGGGVPKR